MLFRIAAVANSPARYHSPARPLEKWRILARLRGASASVLRCRLKFPSSALQQNP
jgi:hypothetical protein